MKTIKRFIGFIFLIIILLLAMVIYSGYSQYKKAIEETPLDEMVLEIMSQENYTFISEVPQFYTNAVVAVEDRRFFYHNGFDIIGTVRAIWTDIKHKELREGGSTITQQLAKNMYFEGDNSPIRKIAEIFMAFDIEKNYSKNEILELYYNKIYYGSGYYNIYEASMGYFGKIPMLMNNNEASMLAGIPNAPSVYSPKNNPDLTKKRQEKVLERMVEAGYIDEEYAIEIFSEQ